MARLKYYYDKDSLSYKKIKLSITDKFKRIFGFLSLSAIFGIITVVVAFQFFDSPKEKRLKSEIDKLELQYEILNKKLDQVDLVLSDIQKRDDNIYRIIFETDPIPISIRKSGLGGVNRYKNLQNFSTSDLMIETTNKIDQITKQLYIQSRSFDEIVKLALNKTKMLASIPAIQPVANKNLRHIASGFGYRIHPIYKTQKMHTGIDFSAPRGTPIYATGDGKIAQVISSNKGYGKHVIINHGFGYQTLYGHMSRTKVAKGQLIKRGEIIGYVGSTGTSVGPHLHYEVIKNNNKINPINFFYNDLSPSEFENIIELASQNNQSFD